MEAKRAIIKSFILKGLKVSQICKEAKKFNINKMLVYRTYKRYVATGDIKIKKKTGRTRTVRTPELVKKVRACINRNCARSCRKLASTYGVSRRSMQRILKDNLNMTAYKKRKIHGITAAQIKKRYDRTYELRRRYADDDVKNIIFSDEKLFVLEETFVAQNDRLYSTSISDIPSKKRDIPRFQNRTTVMVWGALCYNGVLPLIFVDKGVKINQHFYKLEILEKMMPECRKLYPDGNWTFQQDSAPAHSAKSIQAWCEQNCPDFIPSTLWPPASPDLNPLDFFAWGKIEDLLKNKKSNNLEQFKQNIVKAWAEIPIEEIRAAVMSWRKRLNSVRKNKGGHIE